MAQPAPTYAPVILYDEGAQDVKTLLASAKFNPIWLKWFLELVQQTSPSGGVFVPYTGATGNVTLGAHDLTARNVTATTLLQGLAAAITGTAGAGYMDFPAQSANPAAPAAGTLRFHSATTQGFTRFEQDNEAPTNLILGRDNVFIGKNTSGGNIAAGKAVYVTGSTGNVPNIGLAKADSLTTLPAVGVTLDAINTNNFGQVMKLGIISSIDTSAFAANALLYVSDTTAGAFTATRPVAPKYAQPIANVLVSGVGNGSLHVITAPFIGGRESGTDASTFTFAGHVAVEGVTSTGATGTGKLVFDSSPALTTPNIGAATATSLTFGGQTASSYVYGAWTPTLNSFTIVPGTGAITATGEYWKFDTGVWVQCTISGTGTASIASTGNSSNVSGISSIVSVAKDGIATVQDSTLTFTSSACVINKNDNLLYTPTWAAKTPSSTGRIIIAGLFRA